MITVPERAADALGTFLASYMQRRYRSAETRLVELVPSIARIALECIGNSDALYHNVEHTMLVTLAGHDILRGRALHAHMPPEDYAHLIIACVTHDIGYVRGIFVQDDENGVLIDAAGRKVKLPRGASDAALLPHHVDRSKLYIMERIQGIAELDAVRIARAVEGSRFPSSMPAEVERIDEEAALLRAADLIGQLGDPHYIRKANALYHEFEEAASTASSATTAPPTSSTNIRSSTGTAWRHTFNPPFAISTSRRTVGNGLPISTPMFFAPNATLRSGDRRNDVARPHPADGQPRLIARLTDAERAATGRHAPPNTYASDPTITH